MQRAMGHENVPKLTESQVDEVLAQRRQVMDYIHDDNTRDSYDAKFYLVVVLIFITVFSLIVIYWKPELFSQVLSFLAGIFGGGLGGVRLSAERKELRQPFTMSKMCPEGRLVHLGTKLNS
jgi:hypothetical protein